jgi:hypothetical protein
MEDNTAGKERKRKEEMYREKKGEHSMVYSSSCGFVYSRFK